ncbi:MAG: nucleotidyltransferase domain-containing protein [Geoalkalibacter sp.]|jgi:predicted nucleotidyltransferase|uniref:nucleotidyltransferase domain-containing protein n=1 Tax=Geoalkalibacter sp. TaxID=3041440 RepID=UPI003D12D7CD
MLKPDVRDSIIKYLNAVKEAGIEVDFAVAFGSQVKGGTHEWSDIDLLIVSPSFDSLQDRSVVNLLWRLTARVDSRIEPIPCGSRQWREDDSSVIIETARKEGEILVAA